MANPDHATLIEAFTAGDRTLDLLASLNEAAWARYPLGERPNLSGAHGTATSTEDACLS